MKLFKLVLVLALVQFHSIKGYSSTSVNEFEQDMGQMESAALTKQTEIETNNIIDEDHNIEKIDLGIDASLDTEPTFENTQGEDTVEKNLQQATVNKLGSSGKWAFEFIYIDKNGKQNILSQYNIHQQLKPASTEKLFAGYMAYTKQSYPRNNLGAMLHVSHNQMAESVLKSVGGISKLKPFYLDLGLEDFNLWNPVDGSGLSYSNRVTAHLETSLLKRIFSGGKYSDFKMMLAHPTERVCPYDNKKFQIGEIHPYVSTIGKRLGELKDRLHAKTGTLKHTKALSGFVDTEDGGVIIFSVIGDYLKIGTPAAFAKITAVVAAHTKYVDNNL